MTFSSYLSKNMSTVIKIKKNDTKTWNLSQNNCNIKSVFVMISILIWGSQFLNLYVCGLENSRENFSYNIDHIIDHLTSNIKNVCLMLKICFTSCEAYLWYSRSHIGCLVIRYVELDYSIHFHDTKTHGVFWTSLNCVLAIKFASENIYYVFPKQLNIHIMYIE